MPRSSLHAARSAPCTLGREQATSRGPQARAGRGTTSIMRPPWRAVHSIAMRRIADPDGTAGLAELHPSASPTLKEMRGRPPRGTEPRRRLSLEPASGVGRRSSSRPRTPTNQPAKRRRGTMPRSGPVRCPVEPGLVAEPATERPCWSRAWRAPWKGLRARAHLCVPQSGSSSTDRIQGCRLVADCGGRACIPPACSLHRGIAGGRPSVANGLLQPRRPADQARSAAP
jgi:hypothetical protein